MFNPLGHSVYLSEYKSTGSLSDAVTAFDRSPVFLSLHIREEYGLQYAGQIRDLCALLNQHGCRILADISQDTLAQFNANNFLELKNQLGLWALRIDCGLTKAEILELSEQMPIVLNASTTSYQDACDIASHGKEVYAMHNFYPRPDTGLDRAYLKETTDMLHKAGIKVMAFVPGDGLKRGPIHEGLPTLEAHRHQSPYLSYLDLVINFGMDMVFVGDPEISTKEAELINRFTQQEVISVPCDLSAPYTYLYQRVFHNRIDSPCWLIRFQESRAYASVGEAKIAPDAHAQERTRGTITIDNGRYQRYCGEVQLMVQDLPADPRVNIAGHVQTEYLSVVDAIHRGFALVLVHE